MASKSNKLFNHSTSAGSDQKTRPSRADESLRESYQGLENKIAERTRDLSALYAALAPLVSSDPAQLLQQIVERLKEATGADAALIRILDKETKSFLDPAHVGFPASYLEGTQDIDQGSAVAAAFTRNSAKPTVRRLGFSEA